MHDHLRGVRAISDRLGILDNLGLNLIAGNSWLGDGENVLGSYQYLKTLGVE